MKRIKNADDLARAIAELELKAAVQKKDIQETFEEITESLNPVNLVKAGSVLFFPERIKKTFSMS